MISLAVKAREVMIRIHLFCNLLIILILVAVHYPPDITSICTVVMLSLVHYGCRPWTKMHKNKKTIKKTIKSMATFVKKISRLKT